MIISLRSSPIWSWAHKSDSALHTVVSCIGSRCQGSEQFGFSDFACILVGLRFVLLSFWWASKWVDKVFTSTGGRNLTRWHLLWAWQLVEVVVKATLNENMVAAGGTLRRCCYKASEMLRQHGPWRLLDITQEAGTLTHPLRIKQVVSVGICCEHMGAASLR